MPEFSFFSASIVSYRHVSTNQPSNQSTNHLLHPMSLITEQQFGDLTNVQEAMLEILDFERRRIALDLHDRVQNSLRLIRDNNAQNRQLFEELEMVLHEVRTIAYQLTPKSLQEFSLVDYLNIYETNLNLIYGDQFNTDYRTNVDIYIPKSIENQLFSIVQECVNNVLKHATDTPLLCIRLRKEADAIVLVVQDFGHGFDAKAIDTAQTVGLHSIHTRSNFIGAKCEVEAEEGAGCKVRITVPMSVINAHKEEAETYQKATKTNIPRHDELKSYPTQHILVVDNQREIALGLQDLLERNHKKVYIAHSVADAKKILEKHKDIQVVITDITMPDESGMQLVKYVRDTNETTQCIFYSINDNPAYIFRAKNLLQIDAYVWKEEIQTDNDEEHGIMQALEHLGNKDKSGAFYSKQIERIKDTLKMKKYNTNDDGNNRRVFGEYLKLMREIPKKRGENAGVYKSSIHEEIMKNLGIRVTDSEDIRTYYNRYKKEIEFDKEEEEMAVLQKIAKDFGIYSGNDNKK
jgi:DNA-binding NarL/FixJ family response regulator/two-component sensor histidine kinase